MFLFDIVVSLIFILVYYIVLVSPRKDKLFHDVSHKNHYNGPFTMHLDKNEIQAASRTWHIPLDPKFYTWTSDLKIRATHPCDEQPDGSLVKADINLFPSSLATLDSHELDSHVSDSPDYVIDYYFKCNKNGKNILYHCPPGTHFAGDGCVHTEICRVKPEGFKYAIPGHETQYFECENKIAVRKDCPAGEIFMATECHKPNDPCYLKNDGHILEFDRSSFKICRRGVTNINYCGEDEYFHPATSKCVPKICENIQDGVVAQDEIEDRIWKYTLNYTICKNGFVVASKRCGQEQHATINEDMELPRFTVYDSQTKQCAIPKLCSNIFPSKVSVPATKYTRRMANYDHSELYDKLHGYRCDSSSNIVHYVPPPGKFYDDSSVCDPKTHMFPVYGHWNQYYDCHSQSVKSFSTGKIYDHQKQFSINVDESFHKMDNGHPIFKFDDMYHTWIHPRMVRRYDTAICTGLQVHDPTYDICFDPKCKGLGFLSRIQGSKIIMNEDHICVNKNQQVRYEPYQKPKNLKLDFWRQKFVDVNQSISPCFMNTTRLETPDFIMNSTVFPTCDASQPFVFCPSSHTEKIVYSQNVSDSPIVCIPRHTKLYLNPNTWYRVYKSQTAYIQFSEDNTTIERKNGLKTLWPNKEKLYYMGKDFIMNFRINKLGILYKTHLPTNHPEYVINHEKRVIHKAFDSLVEINPPESAKFNFAYYKFKEKLKGFDFLR